MTTRRGQILTILATISLCAAAATGSSACEGILGDPPPAPQPSPGELQAPVLPRLTTVQYRNALVALFGEPLPPTPVQPDTNPYLFTSIGATTDPLSELGVQELEEAADSISHAVFDDPARRSALVGCEPTAPGDACVEGFLRAFGRRAFRRTLTPAELAKWVGVATDLSDASPWTGLAAAVAGMLQAPSFVYRIELGEPDADHPERLRYTGFEMASRISFLFWDAPPDDALLDAAEAGNLDQPGGIEAEARRLLADPRARTTLQTFFAEYLDLGRLDGIKKDTILYPNFTTSLVEAMRTETKLDVDDVVFRRDADVRSIFSAPRTFVNSELATLYGVDAPGATPVAFVPIDLPPDGPRAGMLTLGAFLTMNAHQSATSPTLRGKYLRERVLCAEVPAPPPDVDTNVDPMPGDPKTLRERLESHRQNPACASCHDLLDPPGFLFENFDAIGAYRTLDDGYPIDASGDLEGKPLADARELAALLANEPRVGRCMVKQLYRHALGRLDQKGEARFLDDLHDRFESSSFRFRELLVALVASDSFRFAAPFEVTP